MRIRLVAVVGTIVLSTMRPLSAASAAAAQVAPVRQVAGDSVGDRPGSKSDARPSAANNALVGDRATEGRTQHVLLVMTDGFRWQEVFRGVEDRLLTRENGVRDAGAMRKQFWRETPDARREALWPFVWGTMVRDGQLYGNADAGSVAVVTNGFKFSYPGYSETFSGHADPNVSSNHHGSNENTTVFEWLNGQKGFRGRVAAFATWGAFNRILNTQRSGVPVYDGWRLGAAHSEASTASGFTAIVAAIKRYGRNAGRDAITQQSAIDYLVTRKPRVLFVGFGETDDRAHENRYDLYIRAAHQVDTYLRELWSAVQADPEFRDHTTMIVMTDHGRGSGPRDWRDHGAAVDGSENIWLAVIGPDTRALGMRTNNAPVQQAQVAATIAALLGRDFQATSPGVAPPILDILGAVKR